MTKNLSSPGGEQPPSSREAESVVRKPSDLHRRRETFQGDVAVAAAFSEVLRRIHAAETAEATHREALAGRQNLEARFSSTLDPEQRVTLRTMIGEHCELRLAKLVTDQRGQPSRRFERHAVSREQAGKLGLSEREIDVLGWIANGKRDADIGRILGISVRTVGKHVENILRKLHVESRSAAVAALRRPEA